MASPVDLDHVERPGTRLAQPRGGALETESFAHRLGLRTADCGRTGKGLAGLHTLCQLSRHLRSGKHSGWRMSQVGTSTEDEADG